MEKKTIKQAECFAEQGKTPLFFALNDTFLGMIVVADVMKEDSPQAIKELQNMGIRVVMLTGDNEKTAKAIGVQAGVDEVITFSHTAYSKAVFGKGAVQAAKFLAGKQAGLYDMSDVIGL